MIPSMMGSTSPDAEVTKLKRHLTLLREEYVKLQSKTAELERKYNVLVAAKGEVSEDSFVSRLLKTVAGLFDSSLYSDLNILLDGSTIKAHKFVLSARSDHWGVPSLTQVNELDMRDIPYAIAMNLIRWVYTDSIDFSVAALPSTPSSNGNGSLGVQNGGNATEDLLTGPMSPSEPPKSGAGLDQVLDTENFILETMRYAKRFHLIPLVDKCEKALMSLVNVRNCVKFYQTADEIGADNLRSHCSELISNHWEDFTPDDFAHMSAALLYEMFKNKTEYPLHTAIRLKREDVVFLYLIEYDSQLSVKINQVDRNDELPLDLALRTEQESLAKQLVLHGGRVDAADNRGRTLLHKAILRGDTFSAKFLIEHNANVDIATPLEKETPLHLISSQITAFSDTDSVESVARDLLKHGADPNLQDQNGNTPLHRSISTKNEAVFNLLLNHSRIGLEMRNGEGLTPLACALEILNENPQFATKLVEKGSAVDATNPMTGDTLLHLAARSRNTTAGIFLATHGAKVNQPNNRGETVLHVAASTGLEPLVKVLLQQGANPNLVTAPAGFDPQGKGDESYVYNQTALHLAITSKHESIVELILNHNLTHTNKENIGSSLLIPNLNLKNSKQQTPLSLALDQELHRIAQLLIDCGANVNVTDAEGLTLLHSSISKKDYKGALFLLEYGADIDAKSPSGETPLQMAVKYELQPVVEELCSRGADPNVLDDQGNPPLWVALEAGNEDIASTLVRFNCDTNCWGEGPGGCRQTLLHRALDENNEQIACFLIRSGCDVDSSRKPGEDGQGDEEAFDEQTPLHLACGWALEQVVQTLLEHGADVNARDAEGKSPLHVAIVNQNPNIISLLLSHPQIDLRIRDKYGSTPFATAMAIKNNKAAQAILAREPNAAEKYDGKGRNFLHLAISKQDFDSVLFLLSINVNIHSRVQDSMQFTPLHLAVETGNEMIVRNLLLAGANINDLTTQRQTALHIAAERDHSQICSILLENGIDYDVVDAMGNNALHIACQKGNLASCKTLLTESRINAEALNNREQNPLHLLAHYGRESAAAIFELFMESMPEYPINKVDGDGNSPLLLAYFTGNSNLCKSLVKFSACLGTCNKEGINIFNHQVATKTLLYKLLDMLPQEPPWTEGDSCLECGLKFGLKNRKHHCRHCGRILCAKCSPKEMPIVKFNLTKPVRVCDTCFEVLTLGFN